MGVVRKQSLYITIIVYLGFAIGAFNVLYLFPVFFTPEQFGLTRVLFTGASTFMQLASFGIPAVMIKFFPYYNDRLGKKDNDFLFLSLIIPVIGFMIVSGILLLFQEKAVEVYEKKSPLFVQYFGLLFIFSFFFLLYRILETYLSIVFKNIIPTIIRELVIRIVHLILIILFIYTLATFEQFIYLYVLTYFLGVVLLVAYLIFLKRWHINTKISHVTKRIKKPVYNYGTFLYGGGLFLILAENIDTMLIAGISGLESTAVFAVASYIATIIQVPQKSMNTVVAPMIAQAWKDKNTPLVDKLYKKTAITQLCFSLFVFLLIWVNIDVLFSFLPPVYAQGKAIILIMGIARIIDQGMGINGELLNTSVYWRASFIADVIFVGLSIPLNYFLISSFGIIGSAYANFISLVFFNTFRVLFVWKKMGMQPFTIQSLIAITIGILSYLILLIIPESSNIYINAIIKSLPLSILFISSILIFQVSEDFNLFFKQLKNRIFNS